MRLQANSLSNQLKKLRKERGLSQRQLAQQLGIAVSTVSKAENAQTLPSEKLLQQYSDYFSLSLDELLACRQQEKLQGLMQQVTQDEESSDERYHSINQQTLSLNLVYIPYYDSVPSYLEQNYRKKVELAISKNYAMTHLFALDLDCFDDNYSYDCYWLGVFQQQSHYQVGDVVAYCLDDQHYRLLKIVDENAQHRILKSRQYDITVVLSKDLEDEMMMGKLIDLQLNHFK